MILSRIWIINLIGFILLLMAIFWLILFLNFHQNDPPKNVLVLFF